MKEEKVFDKELFFAALADRTRLRLLNLMQSDELCVCYFPEIIGTNQPKISRHLAYLRRAGLVGARREWKWAHYRIVEPQETQTARVLREIMEWLKTDEAMRLDRVRLLNLCCALRFSNSPCPSRARRARKARRLSNESKNLRRILLLIYSTKITAQLGGYFFAFFLRPFHRPVVYMSDRIERVRKKV